MGVCLFLVLHRPNKEGIVVTIVLLPQDGTAPLMTTATGDAAGDGHNNKLVDTLDWRQDLL